MATAEKVQQRGIRKGQRLLRVLADEFRTQRTALGLSQATVATAAGLSRSRYTRIEGGSVLTLSILEAARLASVLGLDLAARAYPGGGPLRDGAHAMRLDAFGRRVHSPLRFRTEVALVPRGGTDDQRGWDGEIRGAGERTTVELEMRLVDAQAVERRIALKLRDDPPDHFLLLVADTRHNRRVLADHPRLFAGLRRLRPSTVFRALEAGQHPPSGILLV
jgi:transcriptional regulator with XRE-family HTH domain